MNRLSLFCLRTHVRIIVSKNKFDSWLVYPFYPIFKWYTIKSLECLSGNIFNSWGNLPHSFHDIVLKSSCYGYFSTAVTIQIGTNAQYVQTTVVWKRISYLRLFRNSSLAIIMIIWKNVEKRLLLFVGPGFRMCLFPLRVLRSYEILYLISLWWTFPANMRYNVLHVLYNISANWCGNTWRHRVHAVPTIHLFVYDDDISC